MTQLSPSKELVVVLVAISPRSQPLRRLSRGLPRESQRPEGSLPKRVLLSLEEQLGSLSEGEGSP